MVIGMLSYLMHIVWPMVATEEGGEGVHHWAHILTEPVNLFLVSGQRWVKEVHDVEETVNGFHALSHLWGNPHQGADSGACLSRQREGSELMDEEGSRG
jgi:hypothetical protein